MINVSESRGEGTGAEDLEKACNAIGYQAMPLHAKTLPLLLHQVQANNVPAVVLWTQPDGYWVVLAGQRGDYVLVSNPNQGNIRMTSTNFSHHWAGGEVFLIEAPD